MTPLPDGLPVDHPASPRATVDAFFAGIEHGQIEDVLALLSSDVSWEVPGDPDVVPWAGHRVGPDAVRDFYRLLLSETEREAFEIGPLMAHNDLVLAPGRFEYRFPRNDGRYAGEFVIAFTVRDGKVCRYQMHEDSQGLAAAYEGHR